MVAYHEMKEVVVKLIKIISRCKPILVNAGVDSGFGLDSGSVLRTCY